MKITRLLQKIMLFSNPGIDLQITFILFAVSLVAALFFLAITKRRILALILFSILGNLILLMDVLTGSEIFYVYNIVWVKYFSVFIWPVLNIFLIIYYAKTSAKRK